MKKMESLLSLRAKARARLHRHLAKGLIGSHLVYYAATAAHVPHVHMIGAGSVLVLMLVALAVGEEVH